MNAQARRDRFPHDGIMHMSQPSIKDLMVCSLNTMVEGKISSEGAARRAFAPSLNRINPKKPYSRENCRFVLVAVNFALNAFGDEVLDRIVLARRERIPLPTARRLAAPRQTLAHPATGKR